VNRRRLLAGLGGVGVVGAGWGVSTGALPTGQAPEDTVDERVETIEAPGSTAGEQSIPADRPVVVDVMSVNCSVCEQSMPALVESYETYHAEVSFLSISTDPGDISTSTLVEWWDDNDGQWTFGLDPLLAVSRELGVSAIPTTVLIDEDGQILDELRGEKTASALASMIETVVDT